MRGEGLGHVDGTNLGEEDGAELSPFPATVQRPHTSSSAAKLSRCVTLLPARSPEAGKRNVSREEEEEKWAAVVRLPCILE